MCPLPPEFPYEPTLEIVPTEPTPSKQDVEDKFWKENAHLPIDEILKGTRRPQNLPN